MERENIADWQTELSSFIFERNYSYLKEYLELIKSHIKTEGKKLQDLEQRIKSDGPGNDDEYNDYLADVAYEKSELYQLMFRSFTVTVFIYIEDMISHLGRVLEKRTSQTFSANDMKGNGVDRTMKYVSKILKRELIVDPETLSDFQVGVCIRNALVHSDGVLRKESLPLMTSYARASTISLNEQTREVFLSSEYVDLVIDLCRRVHKEVLAAYGSLPQKR